MQIITIVKNDDPYLAAKEVLNLLDFSLADKTVLIKPNLTTANTASSGITTDAKIARAVLERLKNCQVYIGEGCGVDVFEAFKKNGYIELAKEFGAALINLNQDKIVKKIIPHPFYAKTLPIAETAAKCDYFINLSKLKIHSLARATLSLKNLFGAVIPLRNKLKLHPYIRKVIADLYQAIPSHLNIIDGIIGNQRDEVVSCPIKMGVVIGGYHPFYVDYVGAQIMGINPEKIEYLNYIKEILPSFEEIKILGEEISKVKKNFLRHRPLITHLRYCCQDIYAKCLNFKDEFIK
ncbi:MAG: DUF362 domain-containing protein [Armatimonadetes bacterium]|nr:DUF362 domain-containing protein [Armatimonadota bacterium]